MAAPASRDLAIYLLKEDPREPEEYVPKRKTLKRFEVGEGTGKVGILFVQRTKANPPRWAKLFDEFIDAADLGKTLSSSAIFLVKANGRVFALTFGQGRYLLEPDCWEERFGLRVALNSISDNRLRSVDKVTFDALSTHTRTQSSREASATEFGLDIELDLVRAVTGIPNDEALGRRITGMDALHASVRVDLKGLRGLLRRYLEQFEDQTYKTTFPWVDHIAAVNSKTLVGSLNESACKRINNSEGRRWLCIPEIVDWTRVSGFRFGHSSKSPELPDIVLQDFLNALPAGHKVTPLMLSDRRVFAVDADGNQVYSWSVFKCLYCEVDHDGSTYVLSAGKWYRIDRDFVAAVDKSFAAISRATEAMPAYKHSGEGAYCSAIAAAHTDLYALMDQKTIQVAGRYDKIEFCDLFSSTKDLIHIKRYGASSVLSHLFAQGHISAEVFRSEPEFRSKALALLPAAFRWDSEPPSPADFRVVFAVVSAKTGDLTLPFFSRVNLRQTAKRLEAYGYRVAVLKIPVDEIFAKTQKYPGH